MLLVKINTVMPKKLDNESVLSLYKTIKKNYMVSQYCPKNMAVFTVKLPTSNKFFTKISYLKKKLFLRFQVNYLMILLFI